MKKLGNQFGFSKYPKEAPMYSDLNKKTVLDFKDEMAGKTIEAFVGLKPKFYSFR